MWMETCATSRATVTAGPNSAYDLAARTLPVIDPLDLHRLRVCIVGAETVQARTLRAFAGAASGSGFDPVALCPAYVLAEATLGVTMTRPADHWSAHTVDPLALADGDVRDTTEGRAVSCGPP